MELNATPICSSYFTAVRESKSLVTFVSDLPQNFAPSRLYDDACDAGITLINSKTGNKTRWYESGETRDEPESDIKWWELYPTTESVRRNPEQAGWVIRIYNT